MGPSASVGPIRVCAGRRVLANANRPRRIPNRCRGVAAKTEVAAVACLGRAKSGPDRFLAASSRHCRSPRLRLAGRCRDDSHKRRSANCRASATHRGGLRDKSAARDVLRRAASMARFPRRAGRTPPGGPRPAVSGALGALGALPAISAPRSVDHVPQVVDRHAVRGGPCALGVGEPASGEVRATPAWKPSNCSSRFASAAGSGGGQSACWNRTRRAGMTGTAAAPARRSRRLLTRAAAARPAPVPGRAAPSRGGASRRASSRGRRRPAAPRPPSMPGPTRRGWRA